jgi:hypothetical protein
MASFRLPEDKAAWPKVLCLDFNKWVHLARAHYDRSGGEAVKDALRAIRAARDAGKLVVPFGDVNALESQGASDPERRERIIRFLVELSNNLSLLGASTVRDLELARAVGTRLLGQQIDGIRPQLVGVGLPHMFDPHTRRAEISMPDNVRLLYEAFLRSPEGTVQGLLKSLSREHVQALRALDAKAMGVVQATRDNDRGMAWPERRALELGNAVRGSSGLAGILAALDVEEQTFWRWLEQHDNLEQFCRSIPSFEVKAALEFRCARDANKAVDDNDGRDMSFLAVAVPYSNIVVTERQWRGHVEATKLASTYGTRVIDDVRALPEILKAEGCL